MENASKALLMAAGVLIGILIMSLAVYLFISFGSTSADIHEKVHINQINNFNSQFTMYEDKDDITIHDVISVAKLAKEINLKNENTISDKNYIKVFLGNNKIENLDEKQHTNTIKSMLNNNNINKTYNCKVKIDKQTGLVNRIDFTEK